MNTRTFTSNILVVFLAALLSTAATFAIVVSTANASYATVMTVRVTDVSAVESELGSCESGFQVRNDMDAGSGLVPLRRGVATLTSRRGNAIAPAFYCAGEYRGYPTSGVEAELH